VKIGSIVKIILSIAMLALVLSVTDIETLRHTIAGIPASVAVLAVVGFALTQALNASKWWIILNAGGITTRLSDAIKAFFVGSFANVFGFGTVGGDMVRGVLIAQGQPRKTEAITSVFADRALGLAILSLIGVVATAFVGGHHMEPVFVYTLCGVAALVFAGWFIGPLLILRLVPPGNRFRTKVEQISAVFPKRPGAIALVCAISVAFHLSQITLQWLIARGIGIDAPFASMLVTVPFINILSTLPLSWNGVGIRENAYIFFLYPEVFSREQAVAVGAVWLLALTGSSLLGGIISVITGDFRLVLGRRASATGETAGESGS